MHHRGMVNPIGEASMPRRRFLRDCLRMARQTKSTLSFSPISITSALHCLVLTVNVTFLLCRKAMRPVTKSYEAGGSHA